MRRALYVVLAALVLIGCRQSADTDSSPSHSAVARDFFTDGTATAALQSLGAAAQSDRVLGVTVRRDEMSATFETPSGPRAFRVETSGGPPVPKTVDAGLDMTDPVALGSVDLNAAVSRVGPALTDCPDTSAIVFVDAAGRAQSNVLATCGGDWRLRLWLSDLQPAVLEIGNASGLADVVARLDRGWDGNVTSVSIGAGARPHVSVARPQVIVSLWSTENPNWRTAVQIAPTTIKGPTSPLSRLDLAVVDRCRREIAGDAAWSVYAVADSGGGFRLEWSIDDVRVSAPAACTKS